MLRLTELSVAQVVDLFNSLELSSFVSVVEKKRQYFNSLFLSIMNICVGIDGRYLIELLNEETDEEMIKATLEDLELDNVRRARVLVRNLKSLKENGVSLPSRK